MRTPFLVLMMAATLIVFMSTLATIFPFTILAAQGQQGTLAGRVTVGPWCPHETQGKPCPPPKGTYSSRQIILQPAAGGKPVSINLNPNGAFRAKVNAGTYSANLTKCTWLGCKAPNLPRVVAIKPNQTTTLNIDIDTGIR